MSQPVKRTRYDNLAAATAQFYNTTGTVPSNLHLPPDISYLITNQPTCTIVVAELPSGCQDHEIMGLFSRYGQISNVKLVCNGKAALVEFCEISSPTRLVHMAKINPFCVGTNRVRLEFSSESIGSSIDRKTANPQPHSTDIGPTKILHLDIAAADYPITVDVVKAICSPHGKLNRIFIGKKNVDRSLEALVEYNTIEEAKVAKEQLDGADIYSGCCSLTVGFSRLQRVHVTKNDGESWDFTGPNANIEGPLTSAAGQRTLLGPAAAATTAPHIQSQTAPAQICAPPILQAPGAAPQTRGFTSAPPGVAPVFHPPTPTNYYGQPFFGPPGHMYPPPQMAGAGGYMIQPVAYPGYPSAPSMPTSQTRVVRPPAITNAPGTEQSTQVVILPTPTPVHQVTPGGIGIGHSTSNLNTAAASARQCDDSLYESMEGVVLMVNGFPVHLNCDHLFNLLCLYGNIARIKFLKSRPGCALVQVGTAEASDLIYRHFTGVTVFGQTLQFYNSKQTELKEHENLGTLSDGSPVMKNYMSDPNNRFRNAVVAGKSRILEPSRTLHFFNTPLNFTPNDICRVFSDCNAKVPPRVVIFTAKSGQKTSLGLAEWDTLSEALEALILTNHRPIHISRIDHPFHLKLAFSPKPISDDRAGLSLIRYPAPPLSTTQPAVGTASQKPLAEDLFVEVKQQENGTSNGDTVEDQKKEEESTLSVNDTTEDNATTNLRED